MGGWVRVIGGWVGEGDWWVGVIGGLVVSWW